MSERAYVTKDGSFVEELVRPEDGSQRVSLARCTVRAGQRTYAHSHIRSDEIYYALQGKAIVQVGEERVPLEPGQFVFIPAGTVHWIEASEDFVLLCICSPPYQHEDTELVDR